MHEEAQLNEIEALQAIYADDFKPQGDDVKHFKIAVDPENETVEREPVHLEVRFTPNYPDEVPILKIWQSHMLAKDGKRLEDHVKRVAEENIGAEMIMVLVQAAKEWLEGGGEGGSDTPGMTTSEQEHGSHGHEKKADEPHVIKGTIVTPESFLEWRTKFEAEMDAIKGSNSAAERLKKLSGRKMFELDAQLACSDLAFGVDAQIEDDPEIPRRIDEDDDDDDDEDYVPNYDDDDDDDYDDEDPPEEDEDLEAALAAGVKF